jgi:hypothetical protein
MYTERERERERERRVREVVFNFGIATAHQRYLINFVGLPDYFINLRTFTYVITVLNKMKKVFWPIKKLNHRLVACGSPVEKHWCREKRHMFILTNREKFLHFTCVTKMSQIKPNILMALFRIAISVSMAFSFFQTKNIF